MNSTKLEDLRKFFGSEYFTPEMLLENISKYREHPDVLNELGKIMQNLSDSVISFYAP